MEYAIELNNVCKKYSNFKLNDINLKVPTGYTLGFIGENGAGKSTTIKLILGLIRRDSGSISVLGSPSDSITPSLKEDIGVVMDQCCLPQSLNVKELGSVFSSMYKQWDKQAYADYIVRFSLPTNKQIKEFSNGMKRKLEIACALSHNAKLLIFDEATTGLDPVVRDEILEILQGFMEDETHTIFMSSHITSDLEKICDYICLIQKGSLVFVKNKDELLEEYGVLKLSVKELQQLPSKKIIRYRKNEFGAEALVLKKDFTGSYLIDSVTIEDIMLYYTRGKEL